MRTSFLLIAAIALSINSQAQEAVADSTGLPGDNFSLAGALDLFKQSKDLESFERALNLEDQQVNNLDLDGDGQVDYIRVVDNQEGDAHAIVMQVAVSEDELQDVAVIELEKSGKGEATVQIRGAEDLYGPEVIVEPYAEDDGGMQPSKGPSAPDLVRVHVVVNVWAWPCVTWMYGPTFVVWTSPWHWRHYPHWWRPWRPHPYRVFWGWQRPRYARYRPVHVVRVSRAHAVYVPRARYAPRVRTATAPVIQRRAAVRNTPAQQRVERKVQQKNERRQKKTVNRAKRQQKAAPADNGPRDKQNRRKPR